MAQTLTGKQLRWYFQGQAVGMGRVTMLKPDTSTGLEAVKECGAPRIVEYVKKVPETSLNFGYNVFSKGQLRKAMGLGLGPSGNAASGHVPALPDNMDIVEKRFLPGTEGTNNEVLLGVTLYQKVMVEKDTYDQEVDKIVGRSITAKCDLPYDFEGINGIAFESFVGNGVLTNFVSAHSSVGLEGGYLTIRVESPLQTFLKENADYTTSKTASTTTVAFTSAPASGNAILIVYPW